MSLFYFDDGKENSISTKENELLYSVCQETHSMLFWRNLYNTKPLKALTQFFSNTKRFTLLTFFLRINKVYLRFDRKTFCKPITRKYALEVVNQHCIEAMTEHKTSYYIIRAARFVLCIYWSQCIILIPGKTVYIYMNT